MAPKSTIFFERDKRAYASIVDALQTRGIKPEEDDSPQIHTAVKSRGGYEASLFLTASNGKNHKTSPGISLAIEYLAADGITGEVVWDIVLDYRAERDDWYVYCPTKKPSYHGPKPGIDHLVPKSDQYVTTEIANAILKIILDFFQSY